MNWYGIKFNNKIIYLLPEPIYLKLPVPGDIVQIICIDQHPYRMIDLMTAIGCTPDLSYAQAFMLQKDVARPPRPVQCVETGVVYSSMNEAARAIGSSVGNISNHIRHPATHQSVKGYTFHVARS